MPRPSHLNPNDILRFLQVSANPPAASDISRALHLRKSDQRALFKMLAKLRKRGAIDELPGGRYRLAARKSGSSAPREPRPAADSRPPHAPSHAGSARTVTLHRDAIARDEVKGRLVL